MTLDQILLSLLDREVTIYNNILPVQAIVTKLTDDTVWVKEGETPYPIHFLNIRFVQGGEKPFIAIV